MKWTSTSLAHFKKVFLIFTTGLILLTLINFKSYAQQAKQRIYATSDDRGFGGLCLVCGFTDPEKAYDTDLNSASTISVGLGVGGRAYQELIFPAGNRPTGTTGSVVKIGAGSSLVGVNLGAFRFQAYNNGSPVGAEVTASGSLLNLLSSGNQAEIFIPAPGGAYDRVRVTVDGGLLSAAVNLNVYHAYFLKDAANMVCDMAVDELHGISGSVGALGGVADAQNAIDASEATYSTLTSAVGLAGFAQQTVIFLGSSAPGDSVRMLVSSPSALIELNVLNSIAIETFNGNTSNGVIAGSGGLLNLRLLSGPGNQAVISFAPSAVFDRVQLRVGGLLSALSLLRLHDVKRTMPTTVAINGTVGNSAALCVGQAVNLTISNPQAGATYRWYTQASGGTGSTGTSYTPSGLVLGVNRFYVEATRTDCTNASPRREITIAVSAIPAAPQVITNGVSVNSGQSAILTATTEAGNTLRWFATSTGGNALSTSASYTTPNLTTTTTYYVESVNAAGCPSATRVPVTVTVTSGPANPNCNAATTQNSGIDGLLCVLCGVDNPGNSVDANANNFTRLTLAVGVGATGYQRLIFGKTGASTDSVRIELATPVGLADVTALGGITLRVMNGSTVVSTHSLNSNLVNLRLLGGNRFRATVPANGAFDRVEVRFGALVSAVTSLDIYGAEIVYPSPTVASAGLSICSGNTTTITATPNGGTTLRWFSEATGGTLLETGNSFTTPSLTATTTYYIEISKAGCPNSERMPVTVTVTTVPPNPVVAAVPPVCSGSPAVLSVTAPAPGTVYNWYTTVSGTTPAFVGPTYTSPALTANTTYYVQAANGTCLSPGRTAVTVTVNPRPVLPQVQASSTTVNAGQTATLTASSTDANIEFNWYTSAASATRVGTGAVFVTPPLAANTTYYLEAKSTLTGCTAASRVQVTVTVSGPGTPNPVPCEAPTAQVNDVEGGVALLSGVFNPGLAIDNDTQTGSSLVMTAALLGSSVYQRLGFNTLSNAGDTVRVLLSAPGKLLSLGLLSSIRVSTYNGSTPNNDGLALNNPLVRLELLSGNSQALVSFVPTSPFNFIEVRLNSGIAGALSTVDLNYAQRVVAAPQVAATPVPVCANAAATLSVLNPKAGITYKWYNAGGVYQAGKDGATFVTPALGAGTKYFVEANTASGCASARTEVNVTVTQVPTVPVLISPTINTCAGANVVIAVNNPITGITYKWYNAADVYQAGKDGPTFTINGVSSSVSYKVEAVNNCGVASAKATATVNVGTLDAPVVTPASLTVSSGSPAVLTATSSSAGAVFNWYDAPTATTAIFTGAQFVSAPLINNGAAPITVTFYVTASIAGGCPASARTAVVVTVLPAGINTDAPCEVANVTRRQGVDGVALVTGVFNPSLAVDNSAQTASSLVMPVAVLGASVYQHVGFTNLSVVGDTVKVRVSSPGKLLSLGVLPSIELTTYKGLVSNSDMVMASNSLVRVELLSDNSAATFSFVPQQQFDGVELRLRSGLASVLTSLDFNYAQRALLAPSVDNNNLNSCVGSAATLSVKNPLTGTTYKWYRGTTYLTGKDGAVLITDPALPAGTYDYFVTANRNGCESSKVKVVVTVFGAPLPPVAATGNPTTACPNTAVTLSVNPVTGVKFNWYDAAAGGNLLASNTNSFTTSGATAGVYDFYVDAVNSNSCASTTARTKITLTVNPTALASDVTVTGNTTAICAGTTATLNASSITVTSPVFTWYSDAALTSVAFTGAQFVTPQLTASKTYYVTVRGANKCENTAAEAKAVVVTVTPPAVASDITLSGLQSSYCSGSSAVLTAGSATVANPVFTWYSNAALTTIVHTGAVFNLPSLTATTTYYVTVRGTGKCENTAATAGVVTITVNPTPEPPVVASAGTSICSGDATVLSIQNAQTGLTYEWYNVAAGGTAVFTGPQFPTPALAANTDYYVVASSPSGCGNATARVKVTVTVSPKPTTPVVAAASVSACIGSTATLGVSSPQTGVTYRWYTTATGGTSVFQGNPYILTPAATTTYYVEAASAGGCVSSTRTAVVVNILSVLGAPMLTVDEVTSSSITFDWESVAGAAGYEVSVNGGNNWTQLPAGTTQYTVSNLSPGQGITVTARAIGQQACQTSSSTTLSATTENPRNNEVFVPNTFTPNGDGRNDILYVFGNSIAKLRLRVYNQWGEFIYESVNIQNGWDGTYRGRLQPNGVYVYQLEVSFNDGTKSSKKGTITLLR